MAFNLIEKVIKLMVLLAFAWLILTLIFYWYLYGGNDHDDAND